MQSYYYYSWSFFIVSLLVLWPLEDKVCTPGGIEIEIEICVSEIELICTRWVLEVHPEKTLFENPQLLVR